MGLEGMIAKRGDSIYVPGRRSCWWLKAKKVQGVISNFVARYFPDIELRVSRRWAGIHGMTPDGLPIIGHLPDEPEVYFAVGFSGYGLLVGLVAGDRTVDLMLNGVDPGVLSVNRLA